MWSTVEIFYEEVNVDACTMCSTIYLSFKVSRIYLNNNIHGMLKILHNAPTFEPINKTKKVFAIKIN